MSRARARGRAFTLVEMIAAMTVVALLGSITSSLIFTSVASFRDASMRAQLHAEASAALDRVTRSLWSVNRNMSASVVAPDISTVTASSIAWNTNWSLALSGSTLMLTESGGTARALLNNVTAFKVQCYDESNAALAASLSGSATQAIRRVQLQVTVSRDGQTETLRTRVFLRCCASGAAIG